MENSGSGRGKQVQVELLEKPSTLPLHEFVIASRLVKNRAYHRALLLVRAALCLLFLAYRVRQLSCFRHGAGEQQQQLGGVGVVVVGAAFACEVWLAMAFFLTMSCKWFMVERVTHPDRLLSRYDTQLPAVDVFVTTADPVKEPPLIMVNTILSALALEYPSHKLAFYVSDDGGSLLTLWALKEAASFANSWIPFCHKYSPYIYPRAPGPYFSRKGAIEEANFHNFSNEWHAIKAEYEALERRISSMSAAYCTSKRETLEHLLTKLSTSTCCDGQKAIYSSWAWNYDPRNHSSHCEIILDKPPGSTNMGLPLLVYLSREKRPKQKHHFKAGAMNALLRVSGIMTNAPVILNLDCDMYVNDATALLQAMCFFMQEEEDQVDEKIGFVQFPQCFEGLVEDDIYGGRMTATLEILLKGMDGAQGPPYCGTGGIHKRESLYSKMPNGQIFYNGEKPRDMFGCSKNLLLSVEDLLSASFTRAYSPSLINDSIALINCTYEENTSWGKEVGFIYGSVTEDVMTGVKIHSKGWMSVCCTPDRPAFLGCVPSTSEDAFTTRRRWSMGFLEMLFSSYSPLLVNKTKGLTLIQRISYVHFCMWTLESIFLFLYGLLPALSILGEKPIYPKMVDPVIVILVSLFVCINMTGIYENKMVGIGLQQWWNVETMDYMSTVSSNLFAVYDVLKKVLGLSESTFVITPKDQNLHLTSADANHQENQTRMQAPEGFVVHSNLPIFIAPTVLVLVNMAALVTASMCTITARDHPLLSWAPQTEVACCLWILFVLQPFSKGFFLWALGQRGPLALSSFTVLPASLIAGTLYIFGFYLQR